MVTSTEELIDRLKVLVQEEYGLKKERDDSCRILVLGVDASKYSREAVEWARKYNYVTPKDIVVLITVWEEALEQYITTVDMGLYAGLISLNHEEIRRHNDAALENARKVLKQFYHTYLSDCDVFPLIVSSTNLSKNAIGDVICKTAEAIKANTVIVGCHGHGAFKKFFVGSVSNYVLQNATSPVLLVKH